MSGCELTANGGIRASHLLSLSGAKISAFAENESALTADGRIAIENEKIEVGDDLNALSPADEYEGQSAVRLTSTYKRVRTSVLFGEGTPGWVDVIIFVAAGVGVAAAIAVPFIVKAHKRKKLYARLEAEKTEKQNEGL